MRSLDPGRPIVESMFVDTSPLGALPPWRGDLDNRAKQLLSIADVLGLDIYAVRPISTKQIQLTLKWPVWTWKSRVLALQQLAQVAERQTWISEAQAEPWMPARLATMGSSPQP